MKIFEYRNKRINEQKLLIQSLNLELNKKYIISFVGGGGKTSLIYELGRELSEIGKKVIVTTTTHMFMPKSNTFLTGNKSDMINLLYRENLITVGTLCADKDKEHKQNNIEKIYINKEEHLKKISGLPDEIASQLIELADFVLVEADGSKGLPLKVPAQHEPVIFPGSSLVIGICGIDAVGKNIKETCHRPNLVSQFLQVDENHLINFSDVAKILSSSYGQRKNVKCNYKVIINKVDNKIEFEKAKNICEELSKLGISDAIITTFKDNFRHVKENNKSKMP